MKKHEQRSHDPASQKMIKKALEEDIKIVWDRYDAMQPQCGFGELGICCRICNMGPCRIDPFGEGSQEGVCGASRDTIVARNFVRMIASGAAAHSDHGRDIAHTLLMAAKGEAHDYALKGTAKLQRLAEAYGVDTKGKDTAEIGKALGEKCLAEFVGSLTILNITVTDDIPAGEYYFYASILDVGSYDALDGMKKAKVIIQE